MYVKYFMAMVFIVRLGLRDSLNAGHFLQESSYELLGDISATSMSPSVRKLRFSRLHVAYFIHHSTEFKIVIRDKALSFNT